MKSQSFPIDTDLASATDRDIASWKSATEVLYQHGGFEVSAKTDGAFVCGWTIPADVPGYFHFRCGSGDWMSQTKWPVNAMAIAAHADSLLRGLGVRLADCSISAWKAEPLNGCEIVYFIRESGGFIKIGRTQGDAQARLKTLQTGNPRPMEVIATTRKHTESELHARFAEHRVNGEWFAEHPDLLDFIGGLS